MAYSPALIPFYQFHKTAVPLISNQGQYYRPLYLLPPVVFTIQRDQVPYTFLFKDI
jgi:hypothetical protein